MSSLVVTRNVDWGDFGKSITRTYPMPVAAPNYTPHLYYYEHVNHESFSVANQYRIDTPYFGGAALTINKDVSRSMLRAHVFPKEWYDSCAQELQALLAKVPAANTNPFQAASYKQIAWCTHVSWCVYGMLLASNIDPMWWSTGLRFAKNMDYMPPEQGYEFTFNWFSKWPTVSNNTAPTFVASPLGAFMSGTDLGFGMTRSSVIQWFNFMQSLPWAGDSAYSQVTSTDLNFANAFDKDNRQGLARLVVRASMFGGLDKIVTNFQGFTKSADVAAVVDYWKRVATGFQNVPYWKMVQGSVAAWKWYNFGGLAIPKLPVAREDMLMLFDAHMDARKLWRQMIATRLTLDTIKIMYKAIDGDLYGFGKSYYEYAKRYDVLGNQTREELDNPNIPPYEGVYIVAPIFIRTPANTKYAVDVMLSKNQATVCEESGACEVSTGTTAMLLNVEKNVHALEGVLDANIWAPPEALTEVTVAMGPRKAGPPPKVEQPTHSLAVPIATAGAVTALVGYLLWRGHR